MGQFQQNLAQSFIGWISFEFVWIKGHFLLGLKRFTEISIVFNIIARFNVHSHSLRFLFDTFFYNRVW